MTRYKKFINALLTEMFSEDFSEDIVFEIICRYAFADGYLTTDKDGLFILTNKGKNFIKEWFMPKSRFYANNEEMYKWIVENFPDGEVIKVYEPPKNKEEQEMFELINKLNDFDTKLRSKYGKSNN